MAEFKTLPIDKILVPERLREVEEDHAYMIAQSIGLHGLLNPVTVRATPRAERPYTLVAGAHRRRACELIGMREIDVMVVKADKVDGQMVEIEENVFRNELSALDRAIFVRRYRELWEEKHGKISAGGDKRSDEYHSVKLTEWSEDSAQGHFFARVAERMGLSRSAIERAQSIGKGLTPELRQVLRGTPSADNQRELLRLAKLEPDRQKQIAQAMVSQPDIVGGVIAIKQAVELTDPNAKAKAAKTQSDELFDRLVATWDRAGPDTRAAFLKHVREKERKAPTRLPKVTELLAELGEDPRQVTIFDAIKASGGDTIQ